MAARGGPPEAGVGLQPKVKNVIDIEADILEDKRPNIVPLFTKVGDLPPPPRGKRRTEQNDKERYNQFECDLEDKYFERIRLPRERQTIVRNHASMSAVLDEVTRSIDKYKGDPLIVCGLDTEKDGATIQLSIRLQNFDGKGYAFERNILIQMRSKNKRDVFAEGPPTKLKDFIQNGRLVFTGKSIKPDLEKTASVLGIDPSARDEFKYIELQELFDFTMHLLTGYHQAGCYLRVDHGCSKQENESRTCIGEVSLKTVCRFAWENYTLRKLATHRNQHNNFDEWEGPLSEEMEEYGALDSCVSLGSCYAIAEERFGLAPFHFMRKYGGPQDELSCYSLYRILAALDRDEVDSLDTENKGFARSLKAKVDGVIFRNVIDENRRWAYKRRLMTAELRKERAQKDYEWYKIPVLPKTLSSRPLKPSRTPAVPAENWNMEVDAPPPPPVAPSVDVVPEVAATEDAMPSYAGKGDDSPPPPPPPVTPPVAPSVDVIPDAATNDDAITLVEGNPTGDKGGKRNDEFLMDSEGLDVEDYEILVDWLNNFDAPSASGLSKTQKAPQPTIAPSSSSSSSSTLTSATPVTSSSSSSTLISTAPVTSSSSSTLTARKPFLLIPVAAPSSSSSSSSSPATGFKPPKSWTTQRGSRPVPLGRSSSSASPIVRAVEAMIRSEKQDFSLILKPHLTADIEESARFCHDALTRARLTSYEFFAAISLEQISGKFYDAKGQKVCDLYVQGDWHRDAVGNASSGPFHLHRPQHRILPTLPHGTAGFLHVIQGAHPG